MKVRTAMGALVAAAALGALAAAQEGQKLPGPGSGIIKIAGTVDVGNMPAVFAHQAGDWKMAVANVPDVRISTPVAVAPPEFVRKGARYEVTWMSGERQLITVIQVATAGWVRVDGGPRQRWVNLAAARSIDEVP
jgi:hypothetical protein